MCERRRLFGEEDKLDQALLLTATDDTLRLFERPVYDRREDWFPCAAPGLVFRGIPVLITFNRRGIALRYLTQIYAQCIMCVVICSWVRTRLSSVIVPMLLELVFITGGLEAVYRVIHSWEERFDWSLVLKWCARRRRAAAAAAALCCSNTLRAAPGECGRAAAQLTLVLLLK